MWCSRTGSPTWAHALPCRATCSMQSSCTGPSVTHFQQAQGPKCGSVVPQPRWRRHAYQKLLPLKVQMSATLSQVTPAAID